MSLNSTDISNISSLSSDFLDGPSKELGDLGSVDDLEDELDLTNDVTVTTLDTSDKRDVLSPEDVVTADVDASGFEDDYLDFTDDIDADEENTENTDPERSDSLTRSHGSKRSRSHKSSTASENSNGNGNPWIDADSVTDSLQNLNDHGSILSHFQHLYQVESSKSRQKRRAQVRSSNQQIRSFSLSPKHKMDRSKLLRMKHQRSKETSNSRSNKENKDTNDRDAVDATVIRDHDGHQLFSAERVHERRYMKRKLSEDKIRAEKVTECTFSPEIDVKSAGLMHEKRGNKSFFEVVEEDIEERKLKADARQRESEADLMKHATFTPKINRAENGGAVNGSHEYDVFQRLSSHTGSPLLLKSNGNGTAQSRTRSKGGVKLRPDRIYSKKQRNLKGQQSAAMFASPRRIQEMSDRLYRNHEKIELKKQVHKKSIERREEEQRARSKVLAHSRRIIVKAFLSKFKQVILGKDELAREIDNMTCFSYDEIELALKQIGYAQTSPKSATSTSVAAAAPNSNLKGTSAVVGVTKIQQLIALLDPEHTNSVRWGDMKRFFSRIAANKSDTKRNRELYQIMQFMYTQSMLKAKVEHGAPQKTVTSAKWDAKKWEAEVDKQRRKQLLNKERRERESRERRNKEMAACTFVPKINKSTAATTKSGTDEQGYANVPDSEDHGGGGDGSQTHTQTQCQLVDVPRFEQLYEDAQDRKMRQNEKIIERELEHYKEYKSYTFRPTINKNEVLSQAEVAADHEPQGFDQAILRLSEGRIRSKQNEIRQQYEQKKMSLQWEKRAKWLKQNKAIEKEAVAEAETEGAKQCAEEVEDGVDEIVEAMQKVELANAITSKNKRKVKKHTILSATHKLTAQIDALADDDDEMNAI